MEISLSIAKPVVSYAGRNCNYQHRKIVSMSCKAIGNKPENLYKLLSLSSNNATVEEIRKAYRNMALKYHPDVCHYSKKEESEKIFIQLTEAYKVLSDPVSRKEYDYGLSQGVYMPDGKINKVADQFTRKIWEVQLSELTKQASYRLKQKEGSWGSRMRSQREKF